MFLLFESISISQQDTGYEKMALIHKRSIDYILTLAKDSGTKTINTLDSIISVLNKKSITEIVSFIHFNIFTNNGCVIWKEGEKIKGIQVEYQHNIKGQLSYDYVTKNKELTIKKFKDKVVNTPSLDSLFSYPCDLIATIKKFEIDGISSHPWVMYFRIDSAYQKEDVYFSSDHWYSSTNEPLCITGFMDIKCLYTRRGKKVKSL